MATQTHVEKLGSFEDFTPPWGDGEPDADKLAKLLYDTRLDRAKALDEKGVAVAAKAATESELRELKSEAEKAASKDLPEVERLQRELEKAKAAGEKATAAEIENLKLAVALDKGLSRTQAKRLVGTTEEELASDADELVASFGGAGKSGKDEDGDDGKPDPRGRPKKLSNSQDPDPEAGDDISVSKQIDLIAR